MNPSMTLLLAFFTNLLVSIILVRFIYFPKRKKKNNSYVFTFLSLSIILFYVVTMLRSVELSIGVSFGLFAIFSVLRYRTDTIPTREMNYIFCSIALPIINTSLVDLQNWSFVLMANSSILILFFILENGWGFTSKQFKSVVCEDISKILPENREILLNELTEKTGLTIKNIEINNVDTVRNKFSVKIYPVRATAKSAVNENR